MPSRSALPSELPAEDWHRVLGQLQIRFPDVSPKKVVDALKSCNGHAGRAAATLRALSNGGESTGNNLGNTGLRTMRLGTTSPTDPRLGDARSAESHPARDSPFSSRHLDAVRPSKRSTKSVPRDRADSPPRAAEQLTSLLSCAMTSWPSRPEQRSLLPAQIWVARYQPLPPAVTALTYPNKVEVDIAAIAQSMVSVAIANKARMSYLSEILDSAGHVHTALILFRQYDDEGNGYLSWNSGKLYKFILAVFQHYTLIPPSDDHIFQVCGLFGDFGPKEEQTDFLEARECLCALDVLFQAIRAASALPTQETSAHEASSPSKAGWLNRFIAVETHGVVEVQIKSASNLKNMDDGLFGRVCDPFVLARIGAQEFATEAAYNTLHPVWKAPVFQFNVDFTREADRILQLEILDKNRIHRNKTFGKVALSLVGLTPEQTLSLREPLQEGVGELELELTYRRVAQETGTGQDGERAASRSAESKNSERHCRLEPQAADDQPGFENVARKLENLYAVSSIGGGMSGSKLAQHDEVADAQSPTSSMHSSISPGSKKSYSSHASSLRSPAKSSAVHDADLKESKVSATAASAWDKSKSNGPAHISDETLQGLISRIEKGFEAGSRVLKASVADSSEALKTNTSYDVKQHYSPKEASSKATSPQDDRQTSLKDYAVAASLGLSEGNAEVERYRSDTAHFGTGEPPLVLAADRASSASLKQDASQLSSNGDVPKPWSMAEIVAKADTTATLYAERERRGGKPVYYDRVILAWQMFTAVFQFLQPSPESVSTGKSTTWASFTITERIEYEKSHPEGATEFMEGDEFTMCVEEAEVEIQFRVRGLKAGAAVQIMYEHVSIDTGSRKYTEHVVTELRVEKMAATPKILTPKITPKASVRELLGVDEVKPIIRDEPEKAREQAHATEESHQSEGFFAKAKHDLAHMLHLDTEKQDVHENQEVSPPKAEEVKDEESLPKAGDASALPITSMDSYTQSVEIQRQPDVFDVGEVTRTIDQDLTSSVTEDAETALGTFKGKLPHQMRKAELVDAVAQIGGHSRNALERCNSQRLRILLREAPRSGKTPPRRMQSQMHASKSWEPPAQASPRLEDRLRASTYSWTPGQLEQPSGQLDMGGWSKRVYTAEQQARLNVTERGVSRGKEHAALPIDSMRKVELVNALVKESDIPRAALEKSSLTRLRVLLRNVRGEEVKMRPTSSAKAEAALYGHATEVGAMEAQRIVRELQSSSEDPNSANDTRKLEKAEGYISKERTVPVLSLSKCEEVRAQADELQQRLELLENCGQGGSQASNALVKSRAGLADHLSTLHKKLAALEGAAENRANLDARRKREMEESMSHLHGKLAAFEKVATNRADVEAVHAKLMRKLTALEDNASMLHRPDVVDVNGLDLPIYSEAQLQQMAPSRVLEHSQKLYQAIGHGTLRSSPPEDHGGAVKWNRRVYWNHLAPHVEKSGMALAHFSRDALRITVQRARNLNGPGHTMTGAIYCICQIPGKHTSWCQTDAIHGTFNPIWNQELDICEYTRGESLEFTIMESSTSGSGRDSLLGRVVLGSDKFYPDGLEDELPVHDLKKCCRGSLQISIKVDDAAHLSQALVSRERGLRRQLHQYQEQVVNLERTLEERDAQYQQEIEREKQFFKSNFERCHEQLLEEREKHQEAVSEVRRLIEVLADNGVNVRSRNASS